MSVRTLLSGEAVTPLAQAILDACRGRSGAEIAAAMLLAYAHVDHVDVFMAGGSSPRRIEVFVERLSGMAVALSTEIGRLPDSAFEEEPH